MQGNIRKLQMHNKKCFCCICSLFTDLLWSNVKFCIFFLNILLLCNYYGGKTVAFLVIVLPAPIRTTNGRITNVAMGVYTGEGGEVKADDSRC